MIPSPRYCQHCGAANAAGQDVCHACQHPLLAKEAEGTEQPALLKDRYRLLTQVGAGGFGAVYRALDTFSDDTVRAVKQINLRNLSAQEAIEATDGFHREVRLLTNLRHPSLPSIYDFFTDPDHWYVVMDFIEGQTLEDYLKRRFSTQHNAQLPLHEVLAIGMQLCDVLGYLHTREPVIIFRDLKPENIMRTDRGELFLIDFGIARHFTPGKLKDTIPFGSPGYAAPEQYGKAQTTPQADIYSLGALLHYLLSGADPAEHPFDFAPLRLTGLPEAEAAALGRLVRRMVALNVDQRPTSMKEVKEELEHLARTQTEHSSVPVSYQPQQSVYVGSSYYQAGQGGRSLYAPRRKFLRNVLIGGGVAVGFAGIVSLCTLSLEMVRPHYSGVTALTEPQETQMAQSRIFTYTKHTEPVTTVTWSPSGQFIASGSADKTVQVFSAIYGNLVYTFEGYTRPVTATAWSGDAMCIVSAGENDGTAQVWQALHNKQEGQHQGQQGRVLSLSWARYAELIVSGAEDGTVQVWDNAHNNVTVTTYTGHTGGVRAVAFPPDNAMVASGDSNGIIQVWNATNGKTLFTLKGHAGGINSLAWFIGKNAQDENAQYIASASDDGTVRVWDVAAQKTISQFRGHSGKVNCVTRLASTTFLASGGDDGKVYVWSWMDGTILVSYAKHIGPVRSITSSPYENRIASAGDDKTVQVWRWD